MVSTWENSSVTACRSVGRSPATASRSAPVAVGRAATMFSMTGVMFATTSLNASTTLPQSCSMSASAFPNPTTRFCIAACMELMEPEMVCSASFAVVPVMSMLVCITWMASTTSA